MSIMDQIQDLTQATQAQQASLMNQIRSNGGSLDSFKDSRLDQMTTTLSNIYGYMRTQETDFMKTVSSRLDVSNKLVDELLDITSNYYNIMRKESASNLIKTSNEQLLRSITQNDQNYFNKLSKDFKSSTDYLKGKLEEITISNQETQEVLEDISDSVDRSTSTSNPRFTQMANSLKQIINKGLSALKTYSASQLDKRYQYGTAYSQSPSGVLTKAVRGVTDEIATLTQSITGLTTQLVSNVTPALYKNSTYQQLLSTYGTSGMQVGATAIRSAENRANELRKRYDISLEEAREVAIREASGIVTQNGKSDMPSWYTQSSPELDRNRQFEEQQIIKTDEFNRNQQAQLSAFTALRGTNRQTAIPYLNDIEYMMPGLAAETTKLFQTTINTNASSIKDIYEEIAKVTRNLQVDATTLQSMGNSYTMTLRQLTGKNTDLFDKKMKSLIKTTGLLEDSFIDATSIFQTVDDLAYTSLADMNDTQLTTMALQAREAGMSITEYQKYLQTNPDAALTMVNANKNIANRYGLNREDGLSQRELIFGSMILGVNGREGWDQFYQQKLFDPTESERAYQEDLGTNLGDFQRQQAIDQRTFNENLAKEREWFERQLNETYMTDLERAQQDRVAAFLNDPEFYKLALQVEDDTLGQESIGTAAQLQTDQNKLLGGGALDGLEWVASFFSMKLVDGLFKGLDGLFKKPGTSSTTQSATTQGAQSVAEAAGSTGAGWTLPGIIGGVLPGASMIGAGIYGSLEGINAINQSEELARLSGNEEAGTRHKALGIGTTAAGVGTGLLAGIPALAGGLSAAAGGATFGGAAMAGLASIPVVGWVLAGATAVGVSAIKINEALTQTNGAINFIDDFTDQIAQTNAEMTKTNSEYYNDIKSQIEVSDNLTSTYEDLQSQGLIPTSISFEDLSNGLNISNDELSKIAQGLNTTDSTLEAFRNLGINPTTEEFKSLWDPSTGALVATQEKLEELYGENGALTLMAISTGDATSALYTFVDAANEKSAELLGVSSESARNAGARIAEWSDTEKVDANKTIYDEFMKVANEGVLDKSSNSYEYHKWAGFLKDLESAITDETQKSNYSKMVESILSNDKISKEEMAAAFDQGGAGANLRSFFSLGIDRKSALSRQNFDPSVVSDLARSMNIQGLFEDTTAGMNIIKQVDQLAKVLGSASSTSSQKLDASNQLLDLKSTMETTYPQLAEDYKSLFDEVSKQSLDLSEINKSQIKSIDNQTDTLNSSLNDIKKILEDEDTTSPLSFKKSSSKSSNTASDRSPTSAEGGNPYYGWNVSSPYGPRTIGGKYDFHTGIDFPQPSGTPIPVPISGTVSDMGWSPNGYGNWVDLVGDNGYSFKFAHMVQPTHLPRGSRLVAGQAIGYVGTTGWSTGNHLHFEVHDPSGTRMDPATYLSGLPALATHKTGLSNVPYDGYIAELHKDERVLTSNENLLWQKMLSEKVESPGDYEPVVSAIEVLTSIVTKIYEAVNSPTSKIVEQDPSPSMVRQSNLISSYI